MTETESALLGLLRAALFEKPFTCPASVDWNAVLTEAQTQSVLGIVSAQLPENIPSETRAAWQSKDTQRLIGFVRYLYVQDRLDAALREAGIPYAILKGCAAAVQYPRPIMRTMGDIDFIVPQDRFREAWALLDDLGYVFSHGEEGDRHIAFRKDGFSFELHHHFSHDQPVLDAYVWDGLQSVVTGEVEGHAFSMLPPIGNGIVLLDHMRSHLQSGMGLRQTVDWMLYVDRHLDDAAWNGGFCDAAKKCGLEMLAITATRMCQMHLGLGETITWCRGADESLCNRLLDSLLTDGNFGRKYGTGNKIAVVTASIRKNGLFHRLQDSGERNWKALKKHPGLKPFAWLYQVFRYVRQGLTSGRVLHMRQDVRRGEERAQLMRDLGIDERPTL